MRIDIQALRGLAVLLVVLNHTGIPMFHGGYLGVDIFFVISGFLITGLIKKGIENSSFSFLDFYFRRAKRLLPAAYVTFAFTIVLSILCLDSAAFKDFIKQLIGALTFSGNLFLWKQTGYFEGESALKPLLHVWSLSLEEQYYMVLPAAYCFTSQKYWKHLTITLLSVSGLACLICVKYDPSFAFYSLPTRAWELAFGSLATFYTSKAKSVNTLLVKVFYAISIAALLLIPLHPLSSMHPGIDALLICLATTLIILINQPPNITKPFVALFSKIGDISYSLYLVHWPLFAIANTIYATTVPLPSTSICVILSFVLAYMLYRFVENPLRNMSVSTRKYFTIPIAATTIILIATPMFYWKNSRSSVSEDWKRSNFGLSQKCENSSDFLLNAPECQTTANPQSILWGDSYAMQWTIGIAEISPNGLQQATRSVCGPILNYAPMDNQAHNQTWSESCIRFNQSVFDHILQSPSIKVVILSSLFKQYLEPYSLQSSRSWHSVRKTGNKYEVLEVSPQATLLALGETILKLRNAGKRIVIIAPPPRGNFNMGRCLERKEKGLPFLNAASDCSYDKASSNEYYRSVNNILNEVQKKYDVPVIRPDSLICSGTKCQSSIAGIKIYRDEGHLSYEGSRFLAKSLNLGKELLRTAR